MEEMQAPQPAGAGVEAVALASARYLESGVDLGELLAGLVDSVVRELGAERGTLYLLDRSEGTLASLVAHLPEIRQIRLEAGKGVAGWVAEQGRAVRVDDPERDPRFDRSTDERTGFHTRSLLAVPVTDGRAEILGVLQVLNAREGRFTEADERAALDLASQAGRILEFTSLHAELKSRAVLDLPRRALAFRFNDVVGESEAMRRVYELVAKAAATQATVLLTGESGTGKELIARAIHVNSSRREAAFVKIDCTTLPDSLIENELFGHERGAYTGADRAMPGKFEVADGGTVFLDEIGELPAHVQGKLLRVLQDREFERVGGTKPVRTDIRVICATHRDLEAMVENGEFREDLYYRIRVVPVELPPLRDRGEEDLLRLVEHFIARFSRRHSRTVESITPAAVERLKSHRFPGNIRELENCLESAVVLCDDGVIDADDLALARRGNRSGDGAAGGSGLEVGDPAVKLAVLEDAHLRCVLDRCGGNRSEAARRLGISRNALSRRLAKSPRGDGGDGDDDGGE